MTDRPTIGTDRQTYGQAGPSIVLSKRKVDQIRVVCGAELQEENTIVELQEENTI